MLALLYCLNMRIELETGIIDIDFYSVCSWQIKIFIQINFVGNYFHLKLHKNANNANFGSFVKIRMSTEILNKRTGRKPRPVWPLHGTPHWVLWSDRVGGGDKLQGRLSM